MRTSRRPGGASRHAATLAMLALAAAACSGPASDAEGGADEAGPPVIGVRTAVATTRPFSVMVGAIGTVVPRAGHVAALGAPAPTRVTQVLVATGDRVARGQTLVELERGLFQASAEGAAARLTAAERAHERAERLANEGILPRKDVEQAAADLAAARADAAAASRTSALAVLRSPIAGVVTRMSAVLGASVDANQSLVEIADPTTVDVLLALTPGDAARVRTGVSVALTAGQSALGERLGVGTVTDVAGAVDTAARSVAARVRSASWRRPLRIGETVFGQIAVATHAAAITVPVEALVPEGEGFRLFVVDDHGVAHARTVVVGARADSLAEITSGLQAGERVVTYGAYGVEDSARVVPVNATAAQRDSAKAAQVPADDDRGAAAKPGEEKR